MDRASIYVEWLDVRTDIAREFLFGLPLNVLDRMAALLVCVEFRCGAPHRNIAGNVRQGVAIGTSQGTSDRVNTSGIRVNCD